MKPRFRFRFRFRLKLLSQSYSIHQNSSSSSANPTQNHHLDYLRLLADSLRSHQLSLPNLDQALKHLQANQLFPRLSSDSFNLLLDYHPTPAAEQELQSHHYYLYHRIFFLLDRIHELNHLFTQPQLDRFHSIALKQFSLAGLFRPAELIWDQLILPNSQPHPRDQMLMIDCIRTALLPSQQRTQPQSRNDHPNQNQDLLPLTSKDHKRMLNLAESIGNSLVSSTKLDFITERWTVRTVAEIFASQAQQSKLANWLKKTRSLDLELPDQGASWVDPKLTAIVVKMFKDQAKLENMITIYEAASHPSPAMLSHPTSQAISHNLVFDSQSTADNTNLTSPKPKPKRNPILTRTYHDLILASSQANRPHLAIHFLTQAIVTNESYVQDLTSKHPSRTTLPPIPSLRLQPATYSELIPNLVRKRRSTQLKALVGLTRRLIGSTVEELEWIRALAVHRAAQSADDRAKWHTILHAIVPQLPIEQDLETQKGQNQLLERLVFGHHQQPSRFVLAESTAGADAEGAPGDDGAASDAGGGGDGWAAELGLLRVLERARFLRKALVHAVRLIQRLDPLIRKTALNRAIRVQKHLLNRTARPQPLPAPSSFGLNPALAPTSAPGSPHRIRARIVTLSRRLRPLAARAP